MKAMVLLSGCGVYDGAEIQESVLTLLALNQRGIEYQCAAPDIQQSHVVNHITSQDQANERNVLHESARIARGEIVSVATVSINEYDFLVMPGGFGVAKNFTKWAFKGPEGDIDPAIKNVINAFIDANKPICAMCMAPVAIAKALEGKDKNPVLTVGTTEGESPYEIEEISQGMNSLGAEAKMTALGDITTDENNKIVTTPCYMMKASISDVLKGIEKALDETIKIAQS